MDVRCEKCLTVYDFDDSQLTEAGVTVKCTECENLFKVRRYPTAELTLGSAVRRTPAYTPPGRARPSRAGAAGTSEAGAAQAPAERGWMLRDASSGEVRTFRELTTLQAWIVERKATREDEISRAGDSWKRLGDIVELASFFYVVDQAEAIAPPRTPARAQTSPRAQAPATRSGLAAQAAHPDSEDPALTSTSPMSRLPAASENAAGAGAPKAANVGGEPPSSAVRDRGPASMSGTFGDELRELNEPPPRSRATFWAAAITLTLLVSMVVLFLNQRRDLFRRWVRPPTESHNPTDREANQLLLLDTDDGFRRALELLEREHAAQPSNPTVLAALAEVGTIWAWYLRDDARVLERGQQGGVAQLAAQTLRKDAQHHLDDAKRYAGEAQQRDPNAPEVNRAMANFLRVEGAPAAEVERYLERALAKHPDDAQTLYVSGALAYREDRLQEARRQLERANQSASGANPGPGLLRASFLLARIATQDGRKQEAKRIAESILVAQPQHERARALLASLTAAEADAGTAATVAAAPPAAAPPATAPVAPSGAPPPARSSSPSATAAAPPGAPRSRAASPSSQPAVRTPLPQPPARPGSPPGGKINPEMALLATITDYGKLVALGERMLERGKTQAAQKLYEKALVAGGPNRVEAVTGLGYCYLDSEHFEAATGQFKEALTIAPNHGEAIIGLAEAYKRRGDAARALENYRRYLQANPLGPRAAMANKNIHELEPRIAPGEPRVAPSESPPPAPSPALETTPKTEAAPPAREPPAASASPPEPSGTALPPKASPPSSDEHLPLPVPSQAPRRIP